MNQFTVYLFARTIPEDATCIVAKRRLQALQALREELVALGGLCVSAAPDQADLHVEVTNVLGDEDGSILRTSPRGSHVVERHRVVIVRISVADEGLEFVCSDGTGHVTAEHQAAKRIQAWLYGYASHYSPPEAHIC